MKTGDFFLVTIFLFSLLYVSFITQKDITQVLDFIVWSSLFCLLCEMSHTWSENLALLNLTEVISIDLQTGKILSIVINKDVNIY